MAWVGLLLSGYVAWTSFGNQPIAGCTGAGLLDCDLVHNSAWSVWLSVPVALVGLACYAALASLSVLLDWPAPRVSRWINTLFLVLAAVAAGAAVWFIALQVLVIGAICPACMLIHACGIALAGLTITAAVRHWRSGRPHHAARAGLAALRTALPAVPRSGPAPARYDAAPLAGAAAGGTIAVLAALVGGQLFFPAKTFTVSTVELDEPIAMRWSAADTANRPATDAARPDDQRHVAMRPSPDSPLPGVDREVDPAQRDEFGEADRGADPRLDPARTPPPSDEDAEAAPPAAEPAPQRELRLLGGKLTLDLADHPVLGAPDAPNVVVELIAYDCLHCRRMHRTIQEGRQRYGDQLAVVVLPVPLDSACNKYVQRSSPAHQGSCALARFAIAVAAIDRDAFEEFHDWLMEDEQDTPSVREVSSRAYRVVDRDRLRQLAYSDEMNRRLEDNVELYNTLQEQHRATNHNFGLPVQIVGNGIISGAARSADAIFRTWEEHLEMEPL